MSLSPKLSPRSPIQQIFFPAARIAGGVPANGGHEERVLESARFGYWAVARSGICDIDFDVPSELLGR